MKSLQHLNKYFWKYKWRLILGILFAILSTFFGIYVAILVRKATDFMTHAVAEHFSFETTAHELLIYGLLILGTTIVSGFLMFLMRQSIIVMSRLIEYDLKNEIFSHYQSLDMAFYRRNNTGDLMNRISEDVSRVRMYIGPAVMYFASTIATLILVSATMTNVSTKLTLYVLFPLPILVVVIYFVSDLINRMSNKVQEQLSKLSTIAQETFSGIRVLKAYAQEEPTGNYFTSESGVYRKRYLGLIMTEALFSPFILLLMGLSTLLTIYIGGKQAIDGQITYGNIVEFIIYVGKLTWPVASLGWVTSLVQRAAASQKRINEFLNSHSELKIKNSEVDIQLNSVKGNVEFKNVSFVYPDSGIKAIDNISFNAGNNEIVGFLGPNGAGKSTTMKIVTGYMRADSGTVMINGIDVNSQPLEIKKKIGYLPESNPLYYEMYVREYLGFIAELHEIRKNVKNRIEEVIEITGLRIESNKKTGQLSKGYKQRVGLAAALIHNPDVFILDEPTSGLDPNQIIEIRQMIKGLGKNKTVLFSSHILQEVESICDRVVIINKGNIVADDSLSNLKLLNNAQHIVIVEFTESINPHIFSTIDGIEKFEQIKTSAFKFQTFDPEKVKKIILQISLENNLNILSLQSETKSLEEIFKNLTGGIQNN